MTITQEQADNFFLAAQAKVDDAEDFIKMFMHMNQFLNEKNLTKEFLCYLESKEKDEDNPDVIDELSNSPRS